MADDNGNPFATPLQSEVGEHQQAQTATVQASDNGNPFDHPLLSEKSEGQGGQSDFDPNQALSSYGAATRSAIGGLASDTLSAVKGAVGFFNPTPQNEGEGEALKVAGLGGVYVHRLLDSMAPAARAAMHPSEIAQTIHEINNSPDPKGTYLKIAQKTASQGAGQALVALGTEGAIKGAPSVVRAASKTGDIARDVVGGAERAQAPAQSALSEGGAQAASNVEATVPKTNAELAAYRARSVGDEGIPSDSHAQASMSQSEVQSRVAPNRAEMTGKPQEVVSTDLSKSSGFSVKPGPNGSNWVKFHEDVPEANVAGEASAAPKGPATVRQVLGEPIEKLAKAERSTYDQLNRASGTDLKSLYDNAEELQDALDDPTNIHQRSALQKELKTTQGQIAKGEEAAKANGVEPTILNKAVQMTKQRFALEEVSKKIFNNEAVVKGNAMHGAPESINIDSAIKNVENLDKPSRFAPRGTPSRLEQAFGKDGAAQLKKALYDAQAKGTLAQSRQAFAKTLGKWVGIGSVGLIGGEIAKHTLGGSHE